MAHAGFSGRLLRDGDPTPEVKRINAPILGRANCHTCVANRYTAPCSGIKERTIRGDENTNWRLNPELSQSHGPRRVFWSAPSGARSDARSQADQCANFR